MPRTVDNFWARLPRPFFALAPMEDVTDAAFRSHIAAHAAPHVPRVFYTEFTSADGLVFATEHGQSRLRAKLSFMPQERPIVAQLFTAHPERMEQAAALVAELGFDGVDINMGCPDRAVEKQGSGASLMKNPARARALIAAARQGAGGLPVSVKTRVGYRSDTELEPWLGEVLAEKPAALAVHLRTRAELSDVPAHWEWMKRAIAVRDSVSPETVIMGNGDVKNLADARQKAAETGADGIMLGRAVFGNPWLFADRAEAPSREERIAALIEHVHLFQEKLSGLVSEAVMKRHFKAYIGGWHGAAELRAQLMETHTLDEALAVLQTCA
ncbi:tRNA-dihydrouridine synthase [Candidatus Kaiserbacteria bacterium]|nr:tRNA-dihydrouridine synthase [Candidatus Kaiserbacteria bacterium]